MRKKRKRKSIKKAAEQLIPPIPFKDIKFDRSLVMIFLAALIFLISFILYSSDKIPIEEYEEFIVEPIRGDECITDATCPQPRCPGTKGFCENGYCIVRQITPTTVKCFDLKAPICGNAVCEADEMDRCPEDC